ncbi:MAG: archease [Phycisphaerae bacterium]|nr:archease [Phycisphaerae bacterium]
MADRKRAYWEHFEHKADIGVRGVAACKAEAFEQAATAMTAVICDPAVVKAAEQIEICCQGDDDEILLVDWLNRLIYEMDIRGMLFGKFEVSIGNNKLQANVWGEKCDRQKHQPAVEIKGATYTELFVGKNDKEMWVAQCVVDV